jgi:hypothetical protein
VKDSTGFQRYGDERDNTDYELPEIPPELEYLFLIMDNCNGQNKSQGVFMFFLLVWMVV